MPKNRKKTKGLEGMAVPSIPSPAAMMDYSARSLARDAMESSPGFKRLTKHLAREAKKGVSKIVRGAGKKERD